MNAPQGEAELTALRRSIERSRPLGDAHWTQEIVDRLGLETTLRPRGRPRKQKKGS